MHLLDARGTMKKLTLDMDALEITTFTAGTRMESPRRGTLRAHEAAAQVSFPCLTGTETYTCPTTPATCLTC
jgi:hypothetical protein